MILASLNGLMCAVTIIRETQKAWVVQYQGEKKHETRVPKDGKREMFTSVDDAMAWMGVTK
jgi:hypothetical protein